MDNLDLDASEEKKSLLLLLNDNGSDADIGITSSTSGPNKTEKIQRRHVGWHSHFVLHIGVEKKGRRRKDLTDIQEYRYLKNAIRTLKVPKALQAKDMPLEKHQRLKKELMERKIERYKEVLDALWKRNLLLYKGLTVYFEKTSRTKSWQMRCLMYLDSKH
ncbi:uncharacterized protein LOC124438466 [Xenia sp. Carnegie-2017]|uniref:uncharacterized protein LOC124438466 n=1 Tax=Xenia sp. Carnegie-2017 TaxID=2897299 RepID=UPI001F04B09B|nr:uncharacterized protein LOC124438466 [Xenia sp. Carnegie-2017]